MKFQVGLTDLGTSFEHFRDRFILDTRDLEAIHLAEGTKLSRVFADEYIIGENSESPVMSLGEPMSDESTVTIYKGPEVLLKMIESKQIVAFYGTKWYRCQLIPKYSNMFRNDPCRNHYDNFL